MLQLKKPGLWLACFLLPALSVVGFLAWYHGVHGPTGAYLQYRDEFGGANRVLISFTVDKGDIFTPEFFELLREATDEAYFIPGVDRAQVTSIWTPNVRFVEIVEDGFAGGNVVPATFSGSPEDLQTVRENIVKSGRLGQLVANDFSGAIISAQLSAERPAVSR